MADIGDLIRKLVHPIIEIRERALNNLLQKVECGLVNISRFAQQPNLLENLLHLLDLGPHTFRARILKLFQYIFQYEAAKSKFNVLGGVQYLQSLKIVVPLDLVPDITLVLQKFQHVSAEQINSGPRPCESRGEWYPELGSTVKVDSDTLPSASSTDAEHMCYNKGEEQSVDDSCVCDVSEQDVVSVGNESAVTFTTFPWQALTNGDRRVLDSTTQSLLNHDESVVISSLHFLDTVVLKDFPAEVLLQRPAVVQAMYGCVEEEGENAWRVQGPACVCLLTLTQLLNDRVAQFTDPHLSPSGQQSVTPTSSGMATPSTDITRGSCCSPNGSQNRDDGSLLGTRLDIRLLGDGQDRSGSVGGLINGLSTASVHEDDDGDEFILLGMHQLTVGGHCSHVLRVSCPLLVAKRPSLQTVSMRLILACLNLLRRCINPQLLWKQEDENEAVTEITGGIKRIIKNICTLLILNYEIRKSYGNTIKTEDQVLNNQCLVLLLCRVLQLFVPSESFTQVTDNDVTSGMVLVLFDGGFYLGYNSHYIFLLKYLSQVMPDTAAQFKCILFAAEALKDSAKFLQTSSSNAAAFISLAEKAVRVASIHQSSVLIEKLVRGFAKQMALGNAEASQLEKMRALLLQVLSFPDVTVRLNGYTSVLRLVEDSIGISQAANTSLSWSPKILLLLAPSVISCLVYNGLNDNNSKVRDLSQNILLRLLKGRLVMNTSVWTVAVNCWQHSLIHLHCLADSITSLGCAVTALLGELYNANLIQSIEMLRFHLHLLYSVDPETRIRALSDIMQRLAITSARFLPDPRDIQPAAHHDLFIIRQPVQLLFTGNYVIERGRLLKVVELIQGHGVENAVRKAAWSQLAFLLEDPQLHEPFLQMCSLQYLVVNFISMLKQDGSMNLTVEFLPGAVESLRLLATHSSDIRSTLAMDDEFLLCLVRAACLYYVDNHTRSQASCLMALLLLNDVMVFREVETRKNGLTVGSKDFVSVPKHLVSKFHLPFLCDTYSWQEDEGLCPEMRTVHQVLQEEDWDIMTFFKVIWASACCGSLENIGSDANKFSKLSANLNLSEDEVSVFKLSVLRYVLERYLTNIENGTSHQDVKTNLNVLSLHMLQLQLGSFDVNEFFVNDQWIQSLRRFITCRPNSSVDEQLLTHVLNMLSVTILVQNNNSENMPILQFLIREFAREDSAIHQTLRMTGGVTWVASDPNPRALLSVRLFRAITQLIGHTIQRISRFKVDSEFWTQEMHSQLSERIVASLLPVLKPNSVNEPQYYNLVVLGCALECLAHVTAFGWPGDEISNQLVSCLTRVIKTFHEGRGRAHNSYMGRMVTLSSALTLINLLSHPNEDLTKDIFEECSKESSPDWSWLVSLWVYRDPSVTSTGLSVASSLATKPQGTCLLHESLVQVSGGVWGAALSYLLATGRSCLVRSSAAELLIKLTESRPTTNEPWTSPVVTDTLTGESIEGVEALMVLLHHCNFYSTMKISLARLWIYPEQPAVDPHTAPLADWDLSISHLSSFYTPADDKAGSEESQSDHEWESSKISSLTSVKLYETLLKLLINILLLQPQQVIQQLSKYGIIQMIIKQLRYLVPLMKLSEHHFEAVRMVLTLIVSVLKHESRQALSLACDTSLVHLILVILTSGTEKSNIKIVCLELLNILVNGGGWGAARVVEWIVASPGHSLRPLVLSLHSSVEMELQTAAASLLISLLQSVLQDEILKRENFDGALSGVLDMPVKLLNDQEICPGWELCRHLIQLVCDVSDIQEESSHVSSFKPRQMANQEHQHTLLDCLKLVLLVSESSKEAAHHYRLFILPVLSKPLSELQEKIKTLNIHITTRLMSKKELKEIIVKVIQHLELATNWVDGRGSGVEAVSELLVPLLHPLWIPALRTPPLLFATLRFLLAASAHHQVCLYLNRTSGLPGVHLSHSRTSRPLLACITTAVSQQLSRLPNHSRGSTLSFRDLPKESCILSILILTNCARLQESTSVMCKLDLVSSLMLWLNNRLAYEDGINITPYILKLLIVLTSHDEPKMAVYKSQGWVAILHELLQQSSLHNDAMVVIANMSRNHHASRSMLGSEAFIKTIISIVGEHRNNTSMNLALTTLWALLANNKRGQAVIKQYPLQPTLKYLIEIQDNSELCKRILNLL